MERCVMCEKGKLQKIKERSYFYDFDLGLYEIEVCNKCGEKFYGSDVVGAMEKKAKELGVWGFKEKAVVHKLGGSLSLTIKKKLADFVNLKANEEVAIYPEGKKKLAIEVIS